MGCPEVLDGRTCMIARPATALQPAWRRALHQVQLTLLPAANYFIGAGQQHRPRRAQVDIESVRVQQVDVRRREPFDLLEIGTEFQEVTAKLFSRFKAAVAGHHIDISVFVGSGTISGLPDTSLSQFGSV